MRLKPLLTFGGQLAVCGAMVDKSEPIKNISRQITWQRAGPLLVSVLSSFENLINRNRKPQAFHAHSVLQTEGTLI